MNTSQIKLELFRKIDMLEESTVMELYNFLVKKNSRKTDFWEELNTSQKADIEAGLADIAKGNKKDFNKVISKYK
jgi:predicted transcriptional regulator